MFTASRAESSRVFPDPATELAWVIASPPLLAAAAMQPYASFSAQNYLQFWRDWQPTLAPESLLPAQLGRRFETRWQQWLTGHPRWQLRASRLPVRLAGRTLGEFDLLVHDRDAGCTEHWELAVKFYLGDGDLDDPACWWGPQRQDRLDRKQERLLMQQLPLSGTPAGQAALDAAGLAVSTVRAVVKGRFYYPLTHADHRARFADPAHLRGVWATAPAWLDWLQAQPERLACPWPRQQWLQARPATIAWRPFRELVRQVDTTRCCSFYGDDGTALMVVPADWSKA